ncbi:MAG: hypothetical protein R3246_04635 [Acidimicrobiia bacterium]|nr:hypothetical protein [Acidimicrobiia bacterium]
MPSFSVDGGFRYAIPATMDGVDVGRMVRIPLGGRRVRGYVIGVEEGATADLKPIAATSGDVPIFDRLLLGTLQWAAEYYVSPLAAMLEKAAPPNNPRRTSPSSLPALPAPRGGGLESLSETLNRPGASIAVLAPSPPLGLMSDTVTRLLAAGRSSMIVTATAREAEAVFDVISAAAPGRAVIAHGEMPDKSITGAWSRAQSPVALVGTPRVAMWHVAALGAAFVIEEGRRAMKERQTPTVHVREVVRARAERERFPVAFVGPTPTTDVLASRPEIVRPSSQRLWGNVEVIDRRSETTGGSLLTDPVRRALAAVTRRGAASFVFGHRRGYAAAARCGSCRELRRCPGCGSRPDPGDACTRCGSPLGPCASCGGTRFEPLGAGVGRLVAEVGRIVGSDNVRPAPEDAPVVVGTERDLLDLEPVELIVVPDMDGLLHGTNYRAAEDALRLAARLATLANGSGRRTMIQTSDPEHPVVRALVKGDPLPALSSELNLRRRHGYPPAGQLAVLEVAGGAAAGIEALSELCSVLGPAPQAEGQRWLLQAPDLSAARRALRPLVQRWRDGGARVRIDVDPIDL